MTFKFSKKAIASVFVIIALLMILAISLFSCKNQYYESHLDPIDEFSFSYDTGYDDVEYYAVEDAMGDNKVALSYYNSNKKQTEDFIYTECIDYYNDTYTDGVCINKYIGDNNVDELVIPESIEGKPVVWIGSYPTNDPENPLKGALDTFSGSKVKISANVHIISESNVDPDGNTFDIEVDKDSRWYASKDDNLYSKDMVSLLYMGNHNFILPESVVIFEPSNGFDVNMDYDITFGDKVARIIFSDYTSSEDCGGEIIFRGKKNSTAEKYIENLGFSWYYKFVEVK